MGYTLGVILGGYILFVLFVASGFGSGFDLGASGFVGFLAGAGFFIFEFE